MQNWLNISCFSVNMTHFDPNWLVGVGWLVGIHWKADSVFNYSGSLLGVILLAYKIWEFLISWFIV